MNNIINFHAGSKSFIIFRRHFDNGGILNATKIGSVVNKLTTDDKIVYDGKDNVYMDCHHDLLEKIAQMTYESDCDYFMMISHNGGGIDSETVDSDVLKRIELSDGTDTLQGGTNPNIDDLVNNIQNNIPIKTNSMFTSELETDVEYNGSLKTRYVHLN